MDRDHYVVVQRDSQWWIVINGERRGPFDLRRQAVDAAITLVQTNERVGRPGAVSWDDPKEGSATEYVSPTKTDDGS